MGNAHAVLMVLFVTGFALFAYGVTDPGSATGSHVELATTDVDDVPDSSDVVRYQDLSESVRAAFDRAVATGSAVSAAVARSDVDAEYVEYEGQYYRVVVLPAVAGGASVELSLGLVGLVLSTLATVVYLLLRRERYG